MYFTVLLIQEESIKNVIINQKQSMVAMTNTH